MRKKPDPLVFRPKAIFDSSQPLGAMVCGIFVGAEFLWLYQAWTAQGRLSGVTLAWLFSGTRLLHIGILIGAILVYKLLVLPALSREVLSFAGFDRDGYRA